MSWYISSVKAEISLLSTEASGRKSGITTGYRPNHNFGEAENNEMRMGSIKVLNDEWIEPGQTKLAEVYFLMPEKYLIELVPSLKWRIQEGSNLVGFGKVLNVISPYTLTK